MAKQKIKNFKLEPEELKPVTIGIFESRKRSSVSIFLILTSFILVVVFLPQLSDLFNKFFNPEAEIPNGGTIEPIKPPGSDEEEDYHDTFYDLALDLKIERNDITVGGFVVDAINNTLSFNVINNLTKDINLTDLHYYLELYTSDHTLLERIKINGGLIGSGADNNIKKTLGTGVASELDAFVLVKIEEKDYAPIDLEVDDLGNASLVCSRPHEKVTYKFTKGLLKEFSSEVSYSLTDADYATYALKYQEQAMTYSSRPGITSSYIELNGAFNIATTVDLNHAERTTIFNADTFILDTEAKIINFEMEAQGFDCE